VRRLFRIAAKEILNYKLHLAGVQEVRWVRGGTKPVGEYTSFYAMGNANHELDTGFSCIAICEPTISTFHNPIGLHCLLQG
jgi:hypothetical protein